VAVRTYTLAVVDRVFEVWSFEHRLNVVSLCGCAGASWSLDGAGGVEGEDGTGPRFMCCGVCAGCAAWLPWHGVSD
jgi:hypothetical protein